MRQNEAYRDQVNPGLKRLAAALVPSIGGEDLSRFVRSVNDRVGMPYYPTRIPWLTRKLGASSAAAAAVQSPIADRLCAAAMAAGLEREVGGRRSRPAGSAGTNPADPIPKAPFGG